MGLKQLRKRIYCTENELCGAGLCPTGTISLEEHRVGGTEIRRLKMDPQLTVLCSLLARCLKLRLRHSDHAARHPQPYTIWQGSTHAFKVPTKETLPPEAARNLLRASSRHREGNRQLQEGIPSDIMRRRH